MFGVINLYLLIATAACWCTSFLGNMLHVVHDFEEGHSFTRDGFTGLDHRRLDVSSIALAASVVKNWLGWLDISAGWLLADKFALWSWAESWLLALPVALGLFAHWGTRGVWCGTSSAALSWCAYSFALRALLGFAEILRATNIALWLVAMDLASSAWSLFAMNLALWTLAHWVALSWARWVITRPSALRVALRWYWDTATSWGSTLRHDGYSKEEGNHTE